MDKGGKRQERGTPAPREVYAVGERPSRSLKVIKTGVIQQAIHHFLLVVCCNNDSILHHFRDIMTFSVYVTVSYLKTSFIFE